MIKRETLLQSIDIKNKIILDFVNITFFNKLIFLHQAPYRVHSHLLWLFGSAGIFKGLPPGKENVALGLQKEPSKERHPCRKQGKLKAGRKTDRRKTFGVK